MRVLCITYFSKANTRRIGGRIDRGDIIVPRLDLTEFPGQQFSSTAGIASRVVSTYLLPNSGEDGGDTSTSGYAY
jgi:hypothetical protein